jgi:hypothetical protein
LDNPKVIDINLGSNLSNKTEIDKKDHSSYFNRKNLTNTNTNNSAFNVGGTSGINLNINSKNEKDMIIGDNYNINNINVNVKKPTNNITAGILTNTTSVTNNNPIGGVNNDPGFGIFNSRRHINVANSNQTNNISNSNLNTNILSRPPVTKDTNNNSNNKEKIRFY